MTDRKPRYRLDVNNKALVYDDPQRGYRTGEMILVGAGPAPLVAAAQAVAALNEAHRSLDSIGQATALDMAMTVLRNLSRLVVEARRAEDISQRQLGREAGVTLATISRCESGQGVNVQTALKLLAWVRSRTRQNEPLKAGRV